MAGINAALKVKQESPLVLDRTEAYTAILIDDLISKGTNEPYRMFTSRAEFRLHLRIDNADRRLTPHGRRVGLIGDAAWQDFLRKQERAEKLTMFLEKTRVSSATLAKIAMAQQERVAGEAERAARNGHDVQQEESSELQAAGEQVNGLSSAVGASLAQLLKRPEIVIEDLVSVIVEGMPEYLAEVGDAPNANELSSAARNEMKTVETEIKYAGYLDQQRKSMERLKKAEQRVIPEWFDYGKVSGLSREMNEKLQRVRPRTLGQASRIPGVTPAAISLLNVYIEIQGKRFSAAQSEVRA
jgi:tRNA uridine 5-carboxymethylaminomethyl modification enzyme